MKKMRQAWIGFTTICEWLERDGAMVDATRANGRALVCVNCPLNRRGGLFNWFTRFLADRIVKRVGVPQIAQIHRRQLHTCQHCGCALRLLVHVPLTTIVIHKSTDELLSLPRNCWQRKESDI
jgi:hypothetical protein